jgi:hypothetical protein
VATVETLMKYFDLKNMNELFEIKVWGDSRSFCRLQSFRNLRKTTHQPELPGKQLWPNDKPKSRT